MAITPDVLVQRQKQLMSTSRDKALVDRFTVIRNYNVKRSAENSQATLNENEIQVLQSLSARSCPRIEVTPNVSTSSFGGGTKAEMVFLTRFKTGVQSIPALRVIRFVRAAQINRNFGINTAEYTMPGYVFYKKFSEKKEDPPDPQNLHALLIRCFSQSKWSFDGPAQEFKDGKMENEDRPGTMSSDLPYGIMADFLIALYDEKARMILEVGRAAAWLCAWAKPSNFTFVQTR